MPLLKTRAAVFHKPHAPLEIEEVELADLKPEDVLIEIAASGVCHSDAHVYDGFRDWPTPMVLGHEGAGVVQEVGSAVKSVKPGDRVVKAGTRCGQCHGCAAGKPCISFSAPMGYLYDGTSRISRNGRQYYHFAGTASFAEHSIIHYSGAIPVPDDMPLESACLIGCGVPTGIGSAVNTAKVERGSTCVVIGCGGVGLNVVQGCRLMGAGKIIAVDMLDHKLETARAFGATHTVNARDDDVVAAVKELTNGGADFSFEVIGKMETYKQAFDCIHTRGMTVVVGAPPSYDLEINLKIGDLYWGKRIGGGMSGNTIPARDLPWIFDLYRTGQIKLDELVTRRARLEDATDALEACHTGDEVRTVLVMK